MNDLIERIFTIKTEEDFNGCALEVYAYQRKNVAVYQSYLSFINRPEPKHYSEIPHLPISFFKSHDIIALNKDEQVRFLSSGTTGMERSKHLVADCLLYERSFFPTYEHFVGPLADQIVFALLPNYVSQGNSSLIYMVEKLISATNHELSGFYLTDFTALQQAISLGKKAGKKCVLFGVSYALLDFAEHQPDLSGVTIIETGGMKGTRQEMTKEELHTTLCKGFNVNVISSEYGMCELLSQAYSDEDGSFSLPPWMRFSLREVNDPFTTVATNKTGGVNIIDLANIYSCAFIETQDLGRSTDGKLKLMGRFDQSDLRGCNLLVS